MTDEARSTPDLEIEAQREARRAATKRVDRVNDWLHIGGAIPSHEAGPLRDAGVTHVVDLRQEHEVDPAHVAYENIQRLNVPVPNRGAPSIKQLEDLNHWISDQAADGTVYVHCAGGFGRAATMTVGLLVQRGATVDDAEARVRSARPEIRLNDEQREWLREVEARRSSE